MVHGKTRHFLQVEPVVVVGENKAVDRDLGSDHESKQGEQQGEFGNVLEPDHEAVEAAGEQDEEGNEHAEHEAAGNEKGLVLGRVKAVMKIVHDGKQREERKRAEHAQEGKADGWPL